MELILILIDFNISESKIIKTTILSKKFYLFNIKEMQTYKFYRFYKNCLVSYLNLKFPAFNCCEFFWGSLKQCQDNKTKVSK